MCTRFDAAIDTNHTEINKLFINYPKMVKTKAHYKKGQTHECTFDIESYYMGGDDALRQLCIYDKVQQIKNHNSKYTLNKIPLPQHPITRIEIRNRERVPIKKLPQISNQFKNLNVYSLHKIPKISWQFDFFIKVARAEGLKNALLALPKPIRKEFIRKLEVAKSPFWNPEKVWKKWPDVINEILNPNVSNLALPAQSVANG